MNEPVTEVELSVIILSYNTCELTCTCVRTALEDATQTAREVEVIVVDNASTDDTVLALQQFCAVKVIVNVTNLGFTRGNNVGLAAAQGRYLLLLNSDTEVQPGALSTLIEFMDMHLEAGACGPMLLNPNGSLQPSGHALPSVWRVFIGTTKLYRLWKRDFYLERGRDYTQVRQVEELSGAALMVRREVYEKIGGFDPGFFAYYEDVDWCKRMGDAGYTLYYVPAAQVIHQWKGTSRTVSELAYQAGQNSLRYYFAKHHGPLAQRAIQIMLIGKEIVCVVIYTLRRNGDQRRFHQRMLVNVKSPLPRYAVRQVKE